MCSFGLRKLVRCVRWQVEKLIPVIRQKLVQAWHDKLNTEEFIVSCLRGISGINFYDYSIRVSLVSHNQLLPSHHPPSLPVLVPFIFNLSILQSSPEILCIRQSWNSSIDFILVSVARLCSMRSIFKNKQIMFQRGFMEDSILEFWIVYLSNVGI